MQNEIGDVIKEISQTAVNFGGFVLMHCVVIADANRNGELICPFAIFEGDDGRRVEHFESEYQAESVERGWSSMDIAMENSEWWAFGREGIDRVDGAPMDVLLVSVWGPDIEEPITISQAFSRAEDQSLYIIGEPVLYAGKRDGARLIELWNKTALIQGVLAHPQGYKWSEMKTQ